MGSRELLLTLVTSAETVRRFLRGPEIEEHSNITDPEDLRRLLPDRYGRDLLPRVPDRIAFDQRSGLLACQLVVSLDRLPGGFIGIPIGTKALMGALCAPFCNLNGFPVPRFASQPFMVWEHRQLYRLITGALLHQNLAHLTSNLSVLAHSGSRLEAQVGSPAFAALVGSLTLSASTLEVLYSRIAYKRLDDWHGYFLTTSVGASGLAFAIQVMDDHRRGGLVSLLEVATIPVQFRCWLQLLLAQFMLPDAHVGFTGHLCGIFAGLLHVYLPKAVKQLHQLHRRHREQRHEQQLGQQQTWLQRRLADATAKPAARVHQQEDACNSWSDLQIHAVFALVSLGGHQLLRMLQKRLRRRAGHGMGHGIRATSRATLSNGFEATQLASLALQLPSRSRRSSSAGRFL
ncbi:hypothetical protein ABBQ38_005584 [Trebouxia sp. C0009 RCD-2024]